MFVQILLTMIWEEKEREKKCAKRKATKMQALPNYPLFTTRCGDEQKLFRTNIFSQVTGYVTLQVTTIGPLVGWSETNVRSCS